MSLKNHQPPGRQNRKTQVSKGGADVGLADCSEIMSSMCGCIPVLGFLCVVKCKRYFDKPLSDLYNIWIEEQAECAVQT